MKERIIAILNEAGKDWSFDDLKIKVSPHTPPVDINEIKNADGKWVVTWTNFHNKCNIDLEDINHAEVLATIYQRLKYITCSNPKI